MKIESILRTKILVFKMCEMLRNRKNALISG